jgi:signal peptidase I
MNIDYSLVLLVLALVSGLIWLFDVLFLAKPRASELSKYAENKGLSEEEFEAFVTDLDVENKVTTDSESQKLSPQKIKLLEQAFSIQQESTVVEYARSFFPILFAVLVFRSFLFEPFQIPTGSMIPSLNIGDYIVVNKYSYGIRLPVIGTKIIDVNEPQRGDVMVFVPPHDPNYFVKRVVGLPGDHIRYEDKILYINGEEVEQEFLSYLSDRTPPVFYSQEQLGSVMHDIYTAPTPRYMGADYWMQPGGRTVPEGHYYMMGDNRDNSDDSRRWGVVPEENIVGKAVAVWMHKEPGMNLPTFGQNRLINR